MTLGRKWDQLYYVYLAQAANRHPGATLEVAAVAARAQFEGTDRRSFMSQVARGTVAELVSLRLWKDALAVSSRFARDVGPLTAAELSVGVGRAYVRSWLRR